MADRIDLRKRTEYLLLFGMAGAALLPAVLSERFPWLPLLAYGLAWLALARVRRESFFLLILFLAFTATILATVVREWSGPPAMILTGGLLVISGYLFPLRVLAGQLLIIGAGFALAAPDPGRDGILHLGAVLLVAGVFGQVLRTTRRVIEREHLLIEEHNRQVVQQLAAGLILVDSGLRVLKINKAAGRLLGLTEATALYRTLKDLGAAAELQPLAEDILRATGVGERELAIAPPDGPKRLLVRGSLTRDPIGQGSAVILLLEDITNLHRMKQELVRSERLAAVGQLAASVAHEINNPVGGVLGYVQTCLEEGSANREDLEVIRRGLEKVPPAVQRLLDLSRETEHRPAAVPLAPLVRELVRLHAGRSLTVTIEVADDLVVEADPAGLTQILNNLFLNAAEAAGRTGTVTIAARATAEAAAISITDDGPGIPAADLARIYDPFFTTKRAAGGTGLGLTTVLKIAQRHGGTVTAESQPGRTRFVVTLPRGAATPKGAVPDGRARSGH